MQLPYIPRRPRAMPQGASARAITAATLGALLVAAAACGDAVTGPGAPRPPVEPTAHASRASSAQTPAGEEITITRTTETFDRADGRLAPRDRRVKRTKVGRTVTNAPGSASARATPVAPDGVARGDLLPLGITMDPSRRGPSLGLAWRNRHALSGVPGVEVEVEGVGDAPASVLRFYERGALARTVTQAYRWRRGRWELMRRETTTPDGTFHDVIVVEHGAADAAEIDVFRRSMGVGQRLVDPFSFGPLAQFDEECDPCKALRQAKEAAFESFLFQDAAAVLICLLTPPPADVLACAGAALKVGEAYRRFDQADAAYDQCMANPPKCPDEETDGSSGGGGGGGEGGGGGVLRCYYEVWYNVETGEVLSSELLYCQLE